MPRDSLAARARARNLTPACVYYRLHRGWSEEKALSAPAKKTQRRGGRHKAGAVRPVPPMRRNKSGKAIARWRVGSQVCSRQFGPWGSETATAGYKRFAAEWVAGPEAVQGAGLSVGALFEAFATWAHKEYRKNGKVTRSWGQIERARDYVTRLYGEEPANLFTPLALRAVREIMVSDGLSLETIRIYTRRCSQAWKWGAGRSLVPASIHAALSCIEGLKPGRTIAATPKRRAPVDDEAVALTLGHLDSGTADMVRIQRLTGMRPGEVCAMRVCDIDRESHLPAWLYEVAAGKTLHSGQPTTRWIGPQARAILLPYLGKSNADLVFSLSPATYRERIHSACRRAGVAHWTPHQLRHSHATEVARVTGSAQAAADSIGDTLRVGARYVHVDPREQSRREIAERFG